MVFTCMGCLQSKDGVSPAVAERDETFGVDPTQKKKLQAAISGGSFLFEQTINDDLADALVPERPRRASMEGLPELPQGASAMEPIGTAVAIYEYNSGTDIDLKLKEGDKIVLVEKVETWYKGYLEGQPESLGVYAAARSSSLVQV